MLAENGLSELPTAPEVLRELPPALKVRRENRPSNRGALLGPYDPSPSTTPTTSTITRRLPPGGLITTPRQPPSASVHDSVPLRLQQQPAVAATPTAAALQSSTRAHYPVRLRPAAHARSRPTTHSHCGGIQAVSLRGSCYLLSPSSGFIFDALGKGMIAFYANWCFLSEPVKRRH